MNQFRNLGKALQLVREERGLTQAALARLAGVGKSQLSKYERGKDKPKLESLERILTQLAISPAAFFSACQLLDEASDRLNRPEQETCFEPAPLAGILPTLTQQALEQVLRSVLNLQACMVRNFLRIDDHD